MNPVEVVTLGKKVDNMREQMIEKDVQIQKLRTHEYTPVAEDGTALLGRNRFLIIILS